MKLVESPKSAKNRSIKNPVGDEFIPVIDLQNSKNSDIHLERKNQSSDSDSDETNLAEKVIPESLIWKPLNF